MEETHVTPQAFTAHHPPHVGAPPVSYGEKQLPVFCPQCGNRIEIQRGLCGNRIIDAIMLQAERIGTELECQRCDTRFVFQKLEAIEHGKREKGSRRKSVRSH